MKIQLFLQILSPEWPRQTRDSRIHDRRDESWSYEEKIPETEDESVGRGKLS